MGELAFKNNTNHSNNLQYMSTNNNHDSKIIQFPVNHSNLSTNNNNDKIVQFPGEQTDMTVSDWVKIHSKDEDLEKLFLDMDVAMKFLHDNGYCIEVFHPSQIFVLGGMTDHIKFRITSLAEDYDSREKMIKEDIFNSALIQIGIYTKTLDNITPDFLRNNFDEISQFLPESVVPYYRGVVQRNAKVYLSEFVAERNKRDLDSLEEQLGLKEEEKIDKSNLAPLEHNKILAGIYGLVRKDAAFANYLIIPTLILLSLLVIGLVGWIISLF